jgi:hypothetical protein
MGDRDAFAPQSSQPQPLNPNGTMSGPIDASVPVPDESEQFSMYEPPQEFFLYTWFKEQTLIKVGSVIFFFGAVWFVSYAIEQNWISPLMRIALGLLLACSIYGVGYWRQRFEVVQFQVLTVLGSAVFMGTVVASQFAFSNPVLPPSLAFVLMLVSISYTLMVAIMTKVEWLAIVAAVAGLLVPFLVNMPNPSGFLLLVYLLLLSAGLLTVVFFTLWRYVTLVLLVGVVLHVQNLFQASAVGDAMIWLFVVLFSALFFAGTVVSVARNDRPTLVDVSVFGIVTLQFIGFAVTIAPLSAMQIFFAAVVVSVVGYMLRLRNAHADVVSLFAAIALIDILVGTVELFDGFALTIALALEILAVYLMTLRLATVQRSVYVAAGLFVLPVVSGLVDLAHPAWNNSIVHPQALGALTVCVVLAIAVGWTMHAKIWRDTGWLRFTAGSLAVGWYGFSVAVPVVVGQALSAHFDEVVLTVLLLAVLAGVVIVYTLTWMRFDKWRVISLLSVVLPVVGAMRLLDHPAWQSGVWHQPFAACLLVWGGLAGLALLYWMQSRREDDQDLLLYIAYGLLWAVVVFGFMFLSTVWYALYADEVARVVTAVSQLLLVYLLIGVLLFLRGAASRVMAFLGAFIVPVVLLLPSLRFAGWADGVLGVDAVGLYVCVTIAVLLGITLLQQAMRATEVDRPWYVLGAKVLLIGGGLLLLSLVWIISQTVFTSQALGVTVALFVYTIVGLAAYSYGRVSGKDHFKRAGIVMLGLVVLRLALIDVWGMELLWRIVTFMGIGALFIVTSLLERGRGNPLVVEHIDAQEEK